MKRLEELDFARVLAMLAVIMIHVTSGFVFAESRFTLWGINLALFLNQAARFSVPLFMLLSGLSLAQSGKEMSPGAFYKQRLYKIGLPYVIWSALYFLYNWKVGWCSLTVSTFLSDLAKGSAASHLYFIVAIAQLYVLYPLLQKQVRAHPVPWVAFSFCMTHAAQQGMAFLDLGLDLIPALIKPYLYFLFPSWIFYFVLGMALAGKPLSVLRAFAARHRLSILATTVVYGVFYVVEAKLTGTIHSSIKSQLNIYVFLMLLTAFALWSWVQNCAPLRKAVTRLSRCSLNVFYCHIFVLYGFRSIPFFSGGMGRMLLMYAGVTILSILLSLALEQVGTWFRSLRSTSRA